jgi:hypothetical protein
MRKSRYIPLTILIVALPLLILGWFEWDRWNKKRTLADGSVVRLELVGYGNKVRLRTGNRWKDYVGTVLPQKWADKLGAQYWKPAESNILTVVLGCDGALKTIKISLPRGAIVDSHGCEFVSVSKNLMLVQRGVKRELAIFQFSEFPRDERNFQFRLYESEPGRGWTRVGEFPINNPKRSVTDSLKAESLPISQIVDGAPVTFLDAKSGVLARILPPYPRLPGEFVGAVLDFQLDPAAGLEFVRLNEISDRFRQRVGRDRYSVGILTNGFCEICAEAGLCTEDTWKIDVEFARKSFAVTNFFPVTYFVKPRRLTATELESLRK